MNPILFLIIVVLALCCAFTWFCIKAGRQWNRDIERRREVEELSLRELRMRAQERAVVTHPDDDAARWPK